MGASLVSFQILSCRAYVINKYSFMKFWLQLFGVGTLNPGHSKF